MWPSRPVPVHVPLVTLGKCVNTNELYAARPLPVYVIAIKMHVKGRVRVLGVGVLHTSVIVVQALMALTCIEKPFAFSLASSLL